MLQYAQKVKTNSIKLCRFFIIISSTLYKREEKKALGIFWLWNCCNFLYF